MTQMFFVCNQNRHDTTKLLTTANQSEVPIKQYVFITFF